jgi:hypothetical protein
MVKKRRQEGNDSCVLPCTSTAQYSDSSDNTYWALHALEQLLLILHECLVLAGLLKCALHTLYAKLCSSTQLASLCPHIHTVTCPDVVLLAPRLCTGPKSPTPPSRCPLRPSDCPPWSRGPACMWQSWAWSMQSCRRWHWRQHGGRYEEGDHLLFLH